MEQQTREFHELRRFLLNKLEERGYSPITVTGYRYLLNSIESGMKERGRDSYSPSVGQELLEFYLTEHGKNQYYKNLRKVVSRLNDAVSDKWMSRHSDQSRKFNVPVEFKLLLDQYCVYQKDRGLSVRTVKIETYALSWFLDELKQTGCEKLEQLSPDLVSLSCIKVTNHNLWNEIRNFLKFLAVEGHTNIDYSTVVPHNSKPYVIPSVYKIEEVKKVEASIGRDTVIGKRDYAMILLASRMGMRSGDIVRLRLSDFSTPDKGINIIQQKNGCELHLPLIPAVSEAVEDYLRVRPDTGNEYIFLNIVAPYNNVTTGTLRYALRKYMQIAGIEINGRRHGPHSLRSSLATSMINDSVSYETVRKVLGHSSENAIKHYARIDIEHLRECALLPPEASGAFRAFLYKEAKKDV